MILSADPNTITRFSGSGGSGFQVVDSRTGVIGQPTLRLHHAQYRVTPPTDDLLLRRGPRHGHRSGRDHQAVQRPTSGQAGQRPLPQRSPYYTDTGYPTYDPSGAKALVQHTRPQHGTPSFDLLTVPDPLEIKHRRRPSSRCGTRRASTSRVSRDPAGHHHRRLRPREVPGDHLLPVRGGRPPPQLRVVLAPPRSPPSARSGSTSPRNQRPPARAGHARRGAHPTTPPPGSPPTRRPTSGWPRTCPTSGSSSTSSSDVAQDRVQNFANLTLPDGSAATASTKASSSRHRSGSAPNRSTGIRLDARMGKYLLQAPPPVGGGDVHHLGAGVPARPPAPGRSGRPSSSGLTSPPRTGHPRQAARAQQAAVAPVHDLADAVFHGNLG